MSNASQTSLYICLSLWPLDMPQWHLNTWAVLTAMLSIFTTIANGLLIYSLYKTNQLNTITNKFILLMNISDLCTGVFVLPLLTAVISTTKIFRNCHFELVTQYFALLFAYFSFFMLLAVSIDRYIHVTKLNQYSRFMNDPRMKIIATISFVSSAVIAGVAVFRPSFILQVLLNVSDIACVLLMFSLYTLVFRKISLHAENFKKMLGNVSVSKANREAKRELSATKTIRILLGALLILYFPYNTVSAAFAFYRYYKRKDPALSLQVSAYFSYLLVFANAAVNAVLFSFGNSYVKRFIQNKLHISSSLVSPSVTEETKKAPQAA